MQHHDKTIWTIGHSTRTYEAFEKLLLMNGIQLLVDIRTFPGSRRYPHFNKEILSVSLYRSNISYQHLLPLGGRRKPKADSANTTWRHPAFRGYADYMETTAFRQAVCELEKLAYENRTAYMCSEAVWWRCHRALVSDFLKANGWQVMHILGEGKVEEHPYTSPARTEQGKLFYN